MNPPIFYTSFDKTNTNNQYNIYNFPIDITNEYLYRFLDYIYTDYIPQIISLTALNFNNIKHEIELKSSQILEEINIIYYCEKNEILYNEIISLYNVYRQLYITNYGLLDNL